MINHQNPNNPLGDPKTVSLKKALAKQAPIEEDFSWLPHGNLTAEQRQAVYENKGYDEVTKGFENFMTAWYSNYAAFFKRCSKHGPVHLLWGCQHVEEQDEVHPDGVLIVPIKDRCYMLCTKCFNFLEKKRLNLGKEMRLVCEKCAYDTMQRVAKINPNLVRDLRVG